MNKRMLLAVGILVVVLAAACGGDTDGLRDAAATTTTTTTTTEQAIDGLDFVAGSQVDVGDGWTLSPCESGPPLFCARHAGDTQAVIELMTVPVDSYAAVKGVLDKGGSTAEALSAQAAEFHRTFEADRPKGCGRDYKVEPFGPTEVKVAGRPGVMYGFDGKQQGRHVERALQFLTIDGSELHLIATTAVDEGTCMDDGELAEFTVAELARLEPTLVRVIAASRLP